MNKKGFWLAEETLKIIVAVIVVIFLVVFLASLYYANRNSEDLKFAESSLKYLLEQTNVQSSIIDINNPDGWRIMSWFSDKEKIPRACDNLGWKSCICITKDLSIVSYGLSKIPGTDSARERLLLQSDEKGICLENTKEFIVNSEDNLGILIDNPPIRLNVDYSNKQIN